MRIYIVSYEQCIMTIIIIKKYIITNMFVAYESVYRVIRDDV